MKHVFTLVAILAAATLSLGAPMAAGAGPVNLLPNGGFEFDSNGDGKPDAWETPSLPAGGRLVPAPRTGETALLLVDPPVGGRSVAVESVRFPVPVGEPLTLSAWYKPAPNVIGKSEVELRCFSPTQNPRVITLGENLDAQLETPGEWRKLQFTYEPKAYRQDNACMVTLRLVGGGVFVPSVGPADAAADVLFDDIALVTGKQPGS